MSKEVQSSSKEKTTTKKENNKKTNTDENKQSEKEVIVEELKTTAKNVKKEFTKAKDILVNGVKNNTDNIPNEMKIIKNKFSKKGVEVVDKIVYEVNKNTIAKKENAENKVSNIQNKETNNNFDEYKDKLNNALKYIKKKITWCIDYLKKMDRKILIIILAFIILLIFIIPNIFSNETKYKYDYDYVEEIVLKYRVKVHIDFEENLLFSKYNVNLSSFDKTENLKHGKDKDIEFFLEEGEHTLTFTSDDDSNISKQVTINVTSNMEVGFKISCYYDKILITKKYTDKDEEMISNEIKINSDKSAYVYKNYKTVIKDLEKLGFTNIEEKPMYDIELGWTEEGEVDNVKIDGKDNYKRGDVFKSDVKVVVSYHMNINDDPSKIKPPYDSSSASGKKYDEIVKSFKDAGFTNVIAVESSNYFNKTENTVSDIYADGSIISKDKAYKPNTKIEVQYYGNSDDYSSKSSETLSLYYAKKAFEEYGEKKYPYGFKCHWILDLIAQEENEDGTSWYFKVGVTIENAYGNKYDAIAEGKVSGNDYNQKITGFYVN